MSKIIEKRNEKAAVPEHTAVVLKDEENVGVVQIADTKRRGRPFGH